MSLGRGFGFGASAPHGKTLSMTSLVDLFMSTIGIFIIVFALQEIAEPVERSPAPFDGAALCDSDGRFHAYRPDGARTDLDSDALADSLTAAFPQGGVILVGVTPGCAAAEVGGRPAPLAAVLARRDLGRSETETGEPLHRLDIAPVENGHDAWDSLIDAIFSGRDER